MNASQPRTSILRSLGLVAAMSLLSCDQPADKVFDNPFDQSGTNWSPPEVELLTPRLVIGVNDTGVLKLRAWDPNASDRIDSVFWNLGEIRSRSATLKGDTGSMPVAYSIPGTYTVMGWVRDGQGVLSRQLEATVEVQLRPPTLVSIQASSDTVEPRKSVELTMDARDTLSPGKVERYFWQVVGSSKVETTTVAKASFVAESEGTLAVRCWASDDDGITTQDQVKSVPVVSFRPSVLMESPDTAEAKHRARFVAHASDRAPGKVVSYRWKIGSTDTTTTDSVMETIPPSDGILSVAVHAVDDDGNSSDEKVATVPVVSFRPSVKLESPDTAETKHRARFVAHASDRAPGKVVSYRWKIGSTDTTSTDSVMETIPPSEAILSVSVQAVDDDGNTSDERVASIPVVTRAPIAMLVSSDSGEIHHGVVFTASGSDAAPGKVVAWEWTVGTKVDTSTEPNRTFTWGTTGSITVSVRAIDDDGNVSRLPATRQVRILAHAPILTSSNPDTTRGAVNSPILVTFGASDAPTDPKGESVRYEWTTSTGQKGTGRQVQIQDSLPGLVRIDAVAIDPDSLRSSIITRWVRILPRTPELSSPSTSGMRTDTTVAVAWTDCALDSVYEVLLDTLSQPKRVAGKSTSRSLTVQIPSWNRTWYLQVVGRRGKDSAMSAVVRLDVTENPQVRTLLKALSLSTGQGGTNFAFDGAFSPTDVDYEVDVEPNRTTVYVIAAANDLGQRLQIDNNPSVVSSSIATGATVSLVSSPQVIQVKVTSLNGTASRTYRIKVKRNYPQELKLRGLVVGAGTNLSPAFHEDSMTYSVSIPKGDSTSLSWTAVDPGATVVVKRGGAVSSYRDVLRGNAVDTAGVLLEVATSLGYVNTYKIKVKLLPSRNTKLGGLTWSTDLVSTKSFHPDTLVYDLTTPVGDTSITVKATGAVGETQTLTINGAAVVSGTSKAIQIVRGTNLVEVVVKSEDGSTTRTYRLYVTRPAERDAALYEVRKQSGAFAGYDSALRTYRFTLPYLTDKAAISLYPMSDLAYGVRVDGKPLAVGAWSEAMAVPAGDSAQFVATVIAEDTTVQNTYLVRFLRAKPDSARALSGLVLGSATGVTLASPFDPKKDTVLGSVPFSDSLLSVTPTWTGTIRSVSVDGKMVASGNKVDSIKLKSNDTTFVSVVVTAQDSTKIGAYTIKIFRGAPNRDASLLALKVVAPSGVRALTPVFAKSDTAYTLNVPYLDSQLVFTPTATDPLYRQISIQGTPVVSATASAPIKLTPGADTRIEILVVAQDTTVRKTYSVTVRRSGPSTNALLARFGENSGVVSPVPNATDLVYELFVANAVTSVSLAPKAQDSLVASVRVNGTSAATGLITLGEAGTTTNATVLVTAQDPTATRTYTLKITRERGPEAIGGQITADRTLTLALSPYVVEAALVVNQGVTLTIEPGVRLKFNPGINMSVKGTLIAQGTADRKIYFTNNLSGKWGIVLFDSTAVSGTYNEYGTFTTGSILKHCVLENGGASTVANAASLYLKRRAPHLDSTAVLGSGTNGIYGTGLGEIHWNAVEVSRSTKMGMDITADKFHLRHSLLTENMGRGLSITPNSYPAFADDLITIDSCKFLKNVVSGNGAGVIIYPAYAGKYPENMKIRLRGNLFEGNSATGEGGGFYLYNGTGYVGSNKYLLQQNVFRNNEANRGGAMRLYLIEYYAPSRFVEIIENSIEGNQAQNVGGFDVSLHGYHQKSSENLLDSANRYVGNRGTASSEEPSALKIYLNSSYNPDLLSASVVKSQFIDNRHLNQGAAVQVNMLSTSISPTQIRGCLFQGNISNGPVSALDWSAVTPGVISENTFSGNQAILGGTTVSTVLKITGHPVMQGNNFLVNSTDRLLRTVNVLGAADIDARGNWWNSVTPTFYKLTVDGNSNLPEASSLGNFDVRDPLAAPNPSAPAVE